MQAQSATETRANFKTALDRAEQGVSVRVERAGRVSALVDADRLRTTLMSLVSPDVQVLPGEHEWGAYIPAIASVSATGDTFDAAIDDLISAAREYADDWNDHLRHAPNHTDNWGFVQIVTLSDDDALRAWFTR